MSTYRCTVTVDHPDTGDRFWFRIVVYDTLEELHTAAKKALPKEVWDKTIAVFHPGTIDYQVNYGGLMRFCKPYQTTDTIVHECVHAIMHVWRQLYGVKCLHFYGQSEEDFATAVDILFDKVCKAIL